MAQPYVPDAGDVVWLQFSPHAGREQAGRGPAVVISGRQYNGLSGLMLCWPTTTRAKNYPFEVALSGARPSVALADHTRSVDWRASSATAKGRVQAAELAAIRAKLRALIG